MKGNFSLFGSAAPDSLIWKQMMGDEPTETCHKMARSNRRDSVAAAGYLVCCMQIDAVSLGQATTVFHCRGVTSALQEYYSDPKKYIAMILSQCYRDAIVMLSQCYHNTITMLPRSSELQCQFHQFQNVTPSYYHLV